ncbi:extracellular ribonuclease LE-like [Sesamum indicum]|uniref:Extracellular ribonuclease LE-like n=1 Tax=Sesamum indicum TaxID=4182 RepID=A0A6I9SN54_SESIN|nr:extracellular ribonuclease LE-like [Sesamum indicum]
MDGEGLRPLTPKYTNMAKSSWFILVELLLLLECLSHLSISQGQGYDFFYFVQQWPGSYCDTRKACCYPTTGKPAANFTIHGLWPNYNNGSYPSNCNPNSPYNATKISDLLGKMEVDWPTLACPTNGGTRFWTHEWEKHGTCSESVLDQHSYFEAALNIKNKVNLLKVLEDAGIQPNDQFYREPQIREAIKAGIGYTPAITCNTDSSKNRQILEIYLCVDASGKDLIECPKFPTRCKKPPLQFPIF